MTFMAASMDKEDWHRRVALDGWLQGTTLAEFGAWQERVFAGEGVELKQAIWHRDPVEKAKALARRKAAFAAVNEDARAAMDRYNIRYLALPVDQSAGSGLTAGW